MDLWDSHVPDSTILLAGWREPSGYIVIQAFKVVAALLWKEVPWKLVLLASRATVQVMGSDCSLKCFIYGSGCLLTWEAFCSEACWNIKCNKMLTQFPSRLNILTLLQQLLRVTAVRQIETLLHYTTENSEHVNEAKSLLRAHKTLGARLLSCITHVTSRAWWKASDILLKYLRYCNPHCDNDKLPKSQFSFGN